MVVKYRTPALIASATETSTVPPPPPHPSPSTVFQRPSRSSTVSRFRVTPVSVPPSTAPRRPRSNTVPSWPLAAFPVPQRLHNQIQELSKEQNKDQIQQEEDEEEKKMLAPVVTKDMNLFGANKHLGPTNKTQLKNVRARAQSLNEGLSAGSIAKQQLQAARSVSAGGHRAPKSSMSVGNLPSLSSSPGGSGPSSTSSSPPKSFSVRKATLDPIVEGVELGAVSSAPAIVAKKRSGSTPTTENALLNGQKAQPVSNLQKHATSDSLVEKDEKKKKEGGVLGWLSKTFSKKSRSEDEPGTSKDSAEATSSSSSVSGNADEASPAKKSALKKRV